MTPLRPLFLGYKFVGRLSNWVLAAAIFAFAAASAVSAQSVEELVSAVVKLNAHINPDGRTVEALGHEREGSGSRWTDFQRPPPSRIARYFSTVAEVFDSLFKTVEKQVASELQSLGQPVVEAVPKAANKAWD